MKKMKMKRILMKVEILINQMVRMMMVIINNKWKKMNCSEKSK